MPLRNELKAGHSGISCNSRILKAEAGESWVQGRERQSEKGIGSGEKDKILGLWEGDATVNSATDTAYKQLKPLHHFANRIECKDLLALQIKCFEETRKGDDEVV